MKEDTKDARRCFKCGRDLGPKLEWKKMDTEAGPICYVCFNDAASDSRKAGKRRSARPLLQEDIGPDHGLPGSPMFSCVTGSSLP